MLPQPGMISRLCTWSQLGGILAGMVVDNTVLKAANIVALSVVVVAEDWCTNIVKNTEQVDRVGNNFPAVAFEWESVGVLCSYMEVE